MHGCVKRCEQACAGVRVVACGCLRTLRMKGMFVLTPRMRVSMRARSSFSAADLLPAVSSAIFSAERACIAIHVAP